MFKGQKWRLIRIITSLLLFISFFVIDLIIKPDKFIKNSIYLGIYFIIGYDIIINAIRNIFNKQFLDENFLMLIASLGAFFINEAPEAVAVILFYQIGEFFQDYAINKSRKSITDLMNIAPNTANLLKNNEVFVVSPEDVSVDDIILVKPGEKVPLDGVVTKGASELDTKALTGESLLRAVNVGDEVLSGMINTTKSLEIKVTKEYFDSTVQKILELVEDATSKKSKSEKFITKFSKYYTPVVVFLAVLLAFIPSLITKEANVWVYRALNFLVVSCPCALVISVPLSFFIGIGKASKYGLLIKGSTYIESINKANVFVFDKTGTITEGKFEISDILLENNINKEKILRYASIAEQNSNHPVAKVVREAFKTTYQNDYIIEELPGKGVIARNNDETIVCGNEKLFNEQKIIYSKTNLVGTKLYVAVNGDFLGTIIIKDIIKNESEELINYLNSKNHEIYILSGDNEQIVSDLCSCLDIKNYFSELLPHEKVQKLEEIMENNQNNEVVYVGDGINDAPVLIKADVGISMGLVGSDAAIESSDIVIMDDNINSIKKLKKICTLTMKIVKQNIFFAILIKVLVMIFSSVGLTNMWLAIFADVGVAILAILNSFRIGKIKL